VNWRNSIPTQDGEFLQLHAALIKPTDVLLDNAGVWGCLEAQTYQNMDCDNWAFEFNVMAMGPCSVIQTLLSNVLAGQQEKLLPCPAR